MMFRHIFRASSRRLHRRVLSTRAVKSCDGSHAWLTEVMKPTGLFHMNRASAGSVLRLIDLVTGMSALKHAESPGAVTLSFDRVSFGKRLRAFELLRLDSEVVSVGNSSVLVKCEGSSVDLHTGRRTPVMKSYVTYVAMGEDFRPTQVPLLTEPNKHSEAVQRRTAILENWSSQRLPKDTPLADLRHMYDSDPGISVETLLSLAPRVLIPATMKQTRQSFQKIFLPRNVNFAGNVFGGDFLQWMEECARLCAIGFADWPKFVTLNMSQVFFKAPVQMGDVVELLAEVVYVTTHTVHVQTSVKIHRQNGSEVVEDSHSGTFVCLCIHDGENGGGKRPVGRQLLVTGKDEDVDPEQQRINLLKYLGAKRCHELFMGADFHNPDDSPITVHD